MTSYNLFLANFHFVRPFWLLAIIVLFLVIWLLKKHRFHQSPWQQFLPPHLSGVLVEGATNSSAPSKQALHEQLFLIKPFIIGLLSIIALAGPAWQKLPQPVYQTERGSVLIMDMSYSMYATDIKPNRLTRARFKAIDLLNKINDGDVGLVAYAGDAFIISPLTQDIKNIALLLPSLTPEIMPALGANPFAALTLAHEMLTNAGHLTGDIYWFTDDIDNNELSDIFDWSNKFGHQLNILGIGSSNGAPIRLPSGELLKDNKGAIVIPRLPIQKLQSLASRGQGNYQTISNDDSDIDNLILSLDVLNNNKNKQQESQQTGDQWQEQGAWLLLLVLPLTLSYFRRGGAILIIPLTCLPLLFLFSFSLISPASYANENTSNSTMTKNNEIMPAPSFLQKTWQGLWQTNDQQAQQQYNQNNYQGAAQQFEDSQWQGSAHYKAGNYQEALEAFKQGEQAINANSLYNQGNALAKMQKYEQAIDAYEQALKKNSNLQDARDNIEKLKQQQKKEQEKKQEKSDQSKDEKSENDKSEDKGDKQQDNNSQQQSQDKSDKQQDQQSSENSANESQPKEEQQEQSKNESDNKKSDDKSEQKQEQQAKQAEESTEQGKEKTAAQIAAEQQAKETTQKHQQLLNKVTDDPYLLLRNKMQLEYQKRRQDDVSQGVNKKW